MAAITYTTAQRRAIRATGRSVIVSAAAGSGKTAVLAERCAHLVCEAPADAQCNADELLVLTFTDAAASEMRSRIVSAIKERAVAQPNNTRLREQASLVDNAHVSTIHAFCLWMIRRWFTEVGVDPSASMLDATEANLLRRNVLEETFQHLYAHANRENEPLLGNVRLLTEEDHTHVPPRGGTAEAPLAERFVRLVDDYGLGEDGGISDFILRLSAFLTSLPDKESWLQQATARVEKDPHSIVGSLIDELRGELKLQREHCAVVVQSLTSLLPIATFYADLIQKYENQLGKWSAALDEPDSADPEPGFEGVRAAIASFELSARGAPRLSKDADAKIRIDRDIASKAFRTIRERLFVGRLRKRYAALTAHQWIDSVRDTAPYVRTLVDLATTFDDSLTARKRELNVLEFADLETLAHHLLSHADDPNQPSEVAGVLHRRFAYVLVDEFQDISPIQQSILRLVSRESDSHRDNNLFVVGDVRQSIYRFRLAEPALFTERLDAFRSGPAGDAIDLQENFRSRPELLKAVNLLFRGLMRSGFGEVSYDEASELRQGRDDIPKADPRQVVELHVLEREVRSDSDIIQQDDLESSENDVDDDSDEDTESFSSIQEQVTTDLNDPSKWDAIEREAHLIGRTVLRWRDSNERIVEGRPPELRQIAVLLRVARYNADRVAAMLNAMGLPAYAAVGGSLFGSLEARDVMACLTLLDNPQQDIPLASALRSGVLGYHFTEDDLVEIRCHLRGGHFHETVRSYRRDGANHELRNRLDAFLLRLDHYRNDVRRRPLADVVRRLYDDHGYMAYACGLPGGERRRANLLKLYDLARSFGSFHRQGLHRFIRFIESLDREGQELSSAPAIGEAENVVRVMSIHQAKGLEFPVVFVAGLGTKFNLGDQSGRMIFGRRSHIGLRVVDPDRLVEYPSAAHRLVSQEMERAARAEEMRILYVAMTRAEDRLVLVGTRRGAAEGTEPGAVESETPMTQHTIRSASHALDWILPTLRAAPSGAVRIVRGSEDATTPSTPDPLVYRAVFHAADEIATWRLEAPSTADQRAMIRAVGMGAALPKQEPVAPDDPEVERVRRRIERSYPQWAVTAVPATAAVGAFKGTYDFLASDETAVTAPTRDDPFAVPPSRYAGDDDSDPRTKGLLIHRVLQHLNFERVTVSGELSAEMNCLVNAGVLSDDERAKVDTEALAWFIETPLSQAIRKAGSGFRREFHFIAREPPDTFDADAKGDERDFVLIRGIVDGFWSVGETVEIIDYKTDAVKPEDVATHAERYRPQMWLYARALSNMWRQNVCRASLVYLTPRRIVTWDHPGRKAPPARHTHRGTG